MSDLGFVSQRNKLCLERIKIETEQLPYSHNQQRREQLMARLQQIEHEIKQTYETQC